MTLCFILILVSCLEEIRLIFGFFLPLKKGVFFHLIFWRKFDL